MIISRRIFNGKYVALMLIMLSLLIMNFRNAFADTETDTAFADMISSFAEDGLIPGTIGNYLSLGDYEDSNSNMGYSAMIPLMEAEHFVISAKMDWFSANMTPSSVTNGCGFFFSAADETNDHLMVSVRGDGNVYFSGQRNYTVLSYGRTYYGLPSRAGSADLCLIVDGSNVTVYLNGKLFQKQSELPISGNIFGLAVLSGTFQDYGTKCTFGNIHVFTWE